MSLKDMKQSVDIGTVGLLSGIGPGGPIDYAKMRRNTHTVVDSRHSCNVCHKKFYENKYGLYYICEGCFEKVHNEREIAIFNKLMPLLSGIQQVDENLFVLSIDEGGPVDEWRAKLNILYEFSGEDGTGGPILEWLIKDDYSLSQSKD